MKLDRTNLCHYWDAMVINVEPKELHLVMRDRSGIVELLRIYKQRSAAEAAASKLTRKIIEARIAVDKHNLNRVVERLAAEELRLAEWLEDQKL